MSDVVTWKVEAAFGTDPLETTDSDFTADLSDRLRAFPGFSSQRGRSGEFQENEAGTCTIPLDNQDGELTPANTSGTWFGQLLPNRLVRISATYDGDEFWQFTGLIAAYEQVVEPGSPDQVCLLRVVDGFKILNLERVQQHDDYPDRVSGPVLDPIWGYWRLNEPPATRVRPGGYVKVKDNKDRDKKPQRKWRKKKTTRFLTGVSGPEAQVIGRPSFLQANGDGPVAGDLSYGISFQGPTAGASNQKLRIPVPEADDRPGAENAITISCLIYPRSANGLLVLGPEEGGTAAWFLQLTSGKANLQIIVNGLAVSIAPSVGGITANSWWHIVATWRGDTGEGRVYVNGVLVGRTDETGSSVSTPGTMSRGDTGSPIYVANDPNLSGSSVVFDGIMAELVISEHKAGEDFDAAVAALYQSSIAGFGSPANLPLSGERVETILDGIPDAGMPASYYTSGLRDIDPGEQTVLPQRLDESKLELLRRVEETENGMLFVATDGTLTFRDNAWFEAGAGATVFASLASDGVGIDFQGIAPVTNDDMLWPVVTVTREGGNPQTVGDETAFFGQPQEISDTLHTTDAAALDYATRLQERFGQSRSRITSLTLNALSNPLLYPIVLGAELGARVLVAHTYPDGTVEDFDLRIIGINRNSSGVEHVATWTLAPSYYPTVAEWYLGVPGFSELQTTTTLA